MGYGNSSSIVRTMCYTLTQTPQGLPLMWSQYTVNHSCNLCILCLAKMMVLLSVLFQTPQSVSEWIVYFVKMFLAYFSIFRKLWGIAMTTFCGFGQMVYMCHVAFNVVWKDIWDVQIQRTMQKKKRKKSSSVTSTLWLYSQEKICDQFRIGTKLPFEQIWRTNILNKYMP